MRIILYIQLAKHPISEFPILISCNPQTIGTQIFLISIHGVYKGSSYESHAQVFSSLGIRNPAFKMAQCLVTEFTAPIQTSTSTFQLLAKAAIQLHATQARTLWSKPMKDVDTIEFVLQALLHDICQIPGCCRFQGFPMQDNKFQTWQISSQAKPTFHHGVAAEGSTTWRSFWKVYSCRGHTEEVSFPH